MGCFGCIHVQRAIASHLQLIIGQILHLTQSRCFDQRFAREFKGFKALECVGEGTTSDDYAMIFEDDAVATFSELGSDILPQNIAAR